MSKIKVTFGSKSHFIDLLAHIIVWIHHIETFNGRTYWNLKNMRVYNSHLIHSGLTLEPDALGGGGGS